jgi:hypothetical protein
MAGHKKKPVDLGEMADRVNEVLTQLWDAGYEKEVRVIRDFIHAEGFFREMMHTNREVNAELSKQLAELQRRRSIPVVRDTPT